MKTYWIIYGLILLLSVINESRLIYRLTQYQGKLKFTSLTLIYLILAFNLGVSIALNGWEILYKLFWLSFAIWWDIKDFSLGLILHKNLFHLGTGRWDKMFKMWPDWLLLFFRIIVLSITIVLYTHPSIIGFIMFSVTFSVLLGVLFLKSRK